MRPLFPFATRLYAFSPTRQTVQYLSGRHPPPSTGAAIAPVTLHYDKLVPPSGNATDRPLVILHEELVVHLEGISTRLEETYIFSRPPQSRNFASCRAHELHCHGGGCAPLLSCAFVNKCFPPRAFHGGKVAMTCALSPELPPDLLSHLIVADIAPSKGDLSAEFSSYIEALKRIEDSKVTSRKEAQDILTEYEEDPMIRAFLLTNLKNVDSHHSHHNAPLKFQIPLRIIGDSIPELGSFPFEPGERVWDGPTLFIKGTKSKYINDRNIPIAKQFFPNMVLERLEAGHWVHAEKPDEFKTLVTNFIQSH